MMKLHRLVSLGVITALILIGGITTGPHGLFAVEQQNSPKEHPLHIKKMKGHWKVVDATDSTKTLVKAKRGENISWMPLGSDVSFQFPDSTLFGTYSVTAKAGKELSLEVLPEAQPGRYTYSIFCLKDAVFATGDSPPVIIIE
jgi:hypothetical protein